MLRAHSAAVRTTTSPRIARQPAPARVLLQWREDCLDGETFSAVMTVAAALRFFICSRHVTILHIGWLTDHAGITAAA